MSFSKAFKYPFNNFADVFSLVLILTIAVAVFLGIALNSYDWTPILADLYDLDPSLYYIGEVEPLNGMAVFGILGAIVVFIVEGFWISGYSIEVVRAVMSDVESLPNLDFMRNLKDGFYLFVSSLAYWLAFVIILLVTMTAIRVTRSVPPLDTIVVFVSVVVTVIAVALMGWAYLIGMARFAAEGGYKASWEIRKNLRLARENWRNGANLLVYMVVITFVFGFGRGIVDGIFGGVSGMVGVTLSVVIYYFFNLFQHFSTQHLIAQFATEIGISSDHYNPDMEKGKVDFA